jgi:hypothetical protein
VNVRQPVYGTGKDYDYVFDIEGIVKGAPLRSWPFQTVQNLFWADSLKDKLGEKYGLQPHEVKIVYDSFIKELSNRS